MSKWILLGLGGVGVYLLVKYMTAPPTIPATTSTAGYSLGAAAMPPGQHRVRAAM